MFRTLALSLFLLASAFGSSRAGSPFELLFVDKSGCPWCVRFEREVLPIYGKTPMGSEAPLVKVSLDDGQPKNVLLDLPVRFTPTFVLLKDRKEIGRITGYMNDATFWGLLDKMLAEHKDKRP
jgi:thioredoxin-related protein